ncbi:MAG: integrin alpha, partial [Planctomycetota bacterium]
EVRRAGDVNADGFDDIIVGEWLDDTNGRAAGSVSVFAGPHGTELYRFFGDETQDFFGISFGGGGDVNADGFDDIIVGAPGDDNTGDGSGSARIFSGATGEILYQFDGDDDFDDFGFGNAIIGDIDADGFDDFMIGAPQDDNTSTNAGRVTVYSGAVGEVLYLIDGDGGFDEIGIRISGAGDINADGFDDFIIGVTKDDDNGISSGSASVYSGVTGDVLFRYSGENETDQFGSAVNGLGDINGDGFDDFSVSARSTDFAGEASGSVYIYSGANGNLLTRIDGIDELDFFGECEGAAGDLNGDGLNELIFGSSNGGIDNAGYAMVLTPVLCDIADTNCDGICSTADFGAWLIAFTSRAPACDQNTDGTCAPADLNAWVLNYNACIN